MSPSRLARIAGASAAAAIAAAALLAGCAATPGGTPQPGDSTPPSAPGALPAPAAPPRAEDGATARAQPPAARGAPPQDPRLAALAAEPFTCSSEQQCAAFWTRAQAWVSRRSTMAIVTSTATVIETLAPNGPGKLGFRVVREPLGGGRARIGIATACFGGCTDEVRLAATTAFRRFVRGAKRDD